MAVPTLSSSSPDQRLLAAIVFTDVVGFSARMQKDEANTLKHLERDFHTMREFCTALGGTVIKTTGDGLLLCFTSAVQAVEWGLRAQRHFAEYERNNAAGESLRHRVGIHLGDIFVKGDDVMGDGVNIAARVQTEAPSGGVCISQVVYDVVKNKLKLDVVRLEHRKLKNISEAIQIYQVLLEPPPRVAATPVAMPVAKAPEPPPSSILPKLVVIALVLAALGGGGLFFYRAHLKHEAELAESRTEHEKLGAVLHAPPTASVKATAAVTAPKMPEAEPPTPAAPEFDFAKMTRARPATENTTPADERAIEKARAGVQILDTWIDGRLRRYTKEQPLLVPRSNSPQDFTVFTDSSRQLYFAEGGAFRKQNWSTLTAEVKSSIVLSALRSPPLPPRDVVEGAEAFAYLHGLPEMAGALIRERQAAARAAR